MGQRGAGFSLPRPDSSGRTSGSTPQHRCSPRHFGLDTLNRMERDELDISPDRTNIPGKSTELSPPLVSTCSGHIKSEPTARPAGEPPRGSDGCVGVGRLKASLKLEALRHVQIPFAPGSDGERSLHDHIVSHDGASLDAAIDQTGYVSRSMDHRYDFNRQPLTEIDD